MKYKIEIDQEEPTVVIHRSRPDWYGNGEDINDIMFYIVDMRTTYSSDKYKIIRFGIETNDNTISDIELIERL